MITTQYLEFSRDGDKFEKIGEWKVDNGIVTKETVSAKLEAFTKADALTGVLRVVEVIFGRPTVGRGKRASDDAHTYSR